MYHIPWVCIHLGDGKVNMFVSVDPDYIVGVLNGEGPPVPIPNTEVKLTRADNT